MTATPAPSILRSRSATPSCRGTPTPIRSYEVREKERAIIQDIVRLCKERLFKTSGVPEYLEPLACFHMKAAMLQHPERFKLECPEKEYEEMLNLCVYHISKENCPAQETIRLQVIAEAATFLELKKAAEEARGQAQCLEQMLQQIPLIEVMDMRETFKTVEILHTCLLNYMLESGRQMDESGEFTDQMQAEIATGFLSVFPQASCLFWMDLPGPEKAQQTVEMSFVVQGIRIYNKYLGKGGETFHIPFEDYKMLHRSFSEKIMEVLGAVDVKVRLFTDAIKRHLRSLEMQHVLLQRLRDELGYHVQAFSLLDDFQCFLAERLSTVTALVDHSSEHLKAICEIVGSRQCIANELVFPRFEAIGRVHKAVLEELQMLRAHERSSVPLFELIQQPRFTCTPSGIASLCSRTAKVKSYYSSWQNISTALAKLNVLIMYSTFLPKELYTVEFDDTERILKAGSAERGRGFVLDQERVNDAFEAGREVHFGGYCAVALAKHRGLLIQGHPDHGLVDYDGRLYMFSSQDELKQFANAPAAYLQAVELVVRQMPQLIHILKLQDEPAFSSIKISQFVDVLNEPFPCEFATQTSTHIIQPYRWTDETLFKRCLQLQSKETESSQTISSYFRQSSFTQVWLPKEKWTQTRLNKSTKMTRHVRHFHGLRGPPTVEFKMLRTKYDV